MPLTHRLTPVLRPHSLPPLHGAGVLVLGASEDELVVKVSPDDILRYASDDTVAATVGDLHAFLCKADEPPGEAPHPDQKERHEVMCALLRRLTCGDDTLFSLGALEDVVKPRVRSDGFSADVPSHFHEQAP